jgi:hypothetical protein
VVNIADAWEDKRFDNSFDLKTGFRTRSMLVVPIMSRRMELLGCCQLINKGQEGDVFNQSDINFVQVFCAQASLGIENSFENLRLKKHLQFPKSKEEAVEDLQSTLEVALSSTMAERILIWNVDPENEVIFPFKNVLDTFDLACTFDLNEKVCMHLHIPYSAVSPPLPSLPGLAHPLRHNRQPRLPALRNRKSKFLASVQFPLPRCRHVLLTPTPPLQIRRDHRVQDTEHAAAAHV